MPESGLFPCTTKTLIKKNRKHFNSYWEVKNDHTVFQQCKKYFLDHLLEMAITRMPIQYYKEKANIN